VSNLGTELIPGRGVLGVPNASAKERKRRRKRRKETSTTADPGRPDSQERGIKKDLAAKPVEKADFEIKRRRP